MSDDSGVIVNYVAVKRDITREQNLEAQFIQAQKMEVVGRLAGGIAHDFNNILTGVLGFTDILLETTPETSMQRADLCEIRRLGTRAAELTRQLLAFSRRQPLVMETLDLNVLVENTTKMLARLLGEDIELCRVLASDIGWIKADAGQLEQVILNLALNARDALPRGGKLTLETANVDLGLRESRQHRDVTPGAYVMLVITDNGIGMAEDVLAHIFEPFFSTKGLGKGTGLGLATVYGIIEQHGGSIEVSSEPEKGTSFTVFLPRTTDNTAPSGMAPVAPGVGCGREVILLVEDEQSVRCIVERMLRGMGYTVHTAPDGAEAECVFREHPARITLLLTDMVMPGMNGRELYLRLAALKPDLKVLFISGYTDNAMGHHGIMESGMALLHKPFTVEMLGQHVREVLDKE